MAQVFISWASPDQVAVDSLAKRLATNNISFFKYDEKDAPSKGRMVSGDPIFERVSAEIRTAEITLICVSAKSVHRPWIQREMALSVDRYLNKELRAVIPVFVGAIERSQIPDLLLGTAAFNLSEDPGEQELNRLLGDIREKLGQARPRVVPAAVFAMDRERCGKLIKAGLDWQSVQDLAKTVGMLWGETIPSNLLNRYGDKPEDLAPFADGRSIRSLVEDTVSKANRWRLAQNPPVETIAIQWLPPKWLLSKEPEAKHALEIWRRGDHLIIVDSVSMLDLEVNRWLGDLAQGVKRNELRALLWIPPYTRHSAEVPLLTQKLAGTPPTVEAAFEEWRTQLDRCVTFDAGTEIAAQRWIQDAIRYLTRPPTPFAANQQEMIESARNVGVSPHRMWDGGAS